MRRFALIVSCVFAGAGMGVGACSSSPASESGGAGASGTQGSTTAGATSGSSSSSSASSTSGFPFPQVIYQGGPILAAPKIVTITYPGDAMETDLKTFGSNIASNAYWDTIRAGYCASGSDCVGDGPAGTSVAIATAPGASYTDSEFGNGSTLQPYIGSLITNNTLPAPDENTIYAFYFPATTTITLDGSASCTDFDGYHGSFAMGSAQVYYAIIPECPAAPLPITLLQNTTLTASHEFIETATDPSTSSTAYYLNFNDPTTYGWADVLGGEVADMCVDPFGLEEDETTADGFTVQRVWSNENAAKGKNPCLPIPSGEVYFNAFPLETVLTLDVGESEDIQVQALADGPMPAWIVNPQDWTDPNTTYLTFAVKGGTSGTEGPQISVTSGQTITVTVTLKADPTNAMYGEADGVIVSTNTDPKTATKAHMWPFIVLTKADAADAGIVMERARGHRTARNHGFARERARQHGWGR